MELVDRFALKTNRGDYSLDVYKHRHGIIGQKVDFVMILFNKHNTKSDVTNIFSEKEFEMFRKNIGTTDPKMRENIKKLGSRPLHPDQVEAGNILMTRQDMSFGGKQKRINQGFLKIDSVEKVPVTKAA
ncbi:hypothetical protein KY362_04735 [Candidatus Woesearchaeota archaeon]|nr:hypothetical protein [Candidatus Woesearchaeota archaeon]